MASGVAQAPQAALRGYQHHSGHSKLGGLPVLPGVNRALGAQLNNLPCSLASFLGIPDCGGYLIYFHHCSLLECDGPEAVTRFSPGHEHPVVQTGVLACFLVSTGPPACLPGTAPGQ